MVLGLTTWNPLELSLEKFKAIIIGEWHAYEVISGDCSGHIAAVISKNLTGDEAEVLLGMMTHDSTDARIGNSLVVPSTMALYLMHLPVDVVSNVPVLDVANSSTGAQPRSFWDYFFDTLATIADFLFRGLVATLQFMLYVALAMTGIGLIIYILCDPGVQAQISAAINKLIDVFNALLDWAVMIITQIISDLLGCIANSLEAITGLSSSKLTCSMSAANSEINTTGKMSPATKNDIFSVLNGDLFTAFLIVSVIVVGVILAIKGLTNIFGFLVMMAIGLIFNILFQSFLTNSFSQLGSSEPIEKGPFTDSVNWLTQLIIGSGEDTTFSQQFWTFFATIGSCFSLFFLAIYAADNDCFSRCWVVEGLAWGLIGLTLGIISYVRSSIYLAVTSIFISAFTIADTIFHALKEDISWEFAALIGVCGAGGLTMSIFAIPRSWVY